MDDSGLTHKIEWVDDLSRKETVYQVAPRPPWAGVASPLDAPLQPSVSHFGLRGESIQVRESAGLVPDCRALEELTAADMYF
jgi:hypothetical protein